MAALVTRESIQAMLNNPNPVYVQNVIGRALVAIFERQTQDERNSNDTKIDNMIGFSGADAKSGSLTAKSFLKNKRLEQWQLDKWLKPQKNGFARITKYHKQLNEIAVEKAAQQRINQYRAASKGE